MKLLHVVDYIWFVGESFHRRERTPGDGCALIMWCWYLDAMLPVLTFLRRFAADMPFYTLIVPALLAMPWLYCRLRYTEKRRKEIFAAFHGVQAGGRWLFVWASMVVVCALEAWLMLHFGFWRAARP